MSLHRSTRSTDAVLTNPRGLPGLHVNHLVGIAVILQAEQHWNDDGRKADGHAQIEQQQVLCHAGEKLRQRTAKFARLRRVMALVWLGRIARDRTYYIV